jgi:ABC-2 type transport system permease protein
VSVPALLVTTIVGSAAFAGLGLAIAGSLRPEAALLVANVLFLLALGFSGVLVPIADLPAPVESIVRLLPVGALAEAFGAALGDGASIIRPLIILTGWAVAADVLAARLFRWD